MSKEYFNYIVRIQYLGFRYSGWQIQPGQRTVEGMLIKTLKFILPDVEVKILASGRTDAKVSALDAVFELFVADNPLTKLEQLLKTFNDNLPPDIRIMEINLKDSDFNIIQHAKRKEYLYLFSFGEKNHPFCAPFMANVIDELNIDVMIEAATLYEGEHNFSSYTANLKPNTQVVRHIDTCRIEENTILTANFFPKKSYVLRIVGAGFMRYQIRMIMGALLELGKGHLTLDQIKDSLNPEKGIVLNSIAPGSGLILNSVKYTKG
ncbi:tRNA pseudouridine(38-40) synthase TruA [Maribacter aestuarii]|uniref:tRNA pseudouridine(38-40) synthase TruA n=1 Tax=Maribacter aestuarii TaxID=1130723 RepID=UPI00248CEF72|nr:tRNA pseudouridine(38-40) synthase TruA [Maribacter aestuarii]